MNAKILQSIAESLATSECGFVRVRCTDCGVHGMVSIERDYTLPEVCKNCEGRMELQEDEDA